MVSRLRVVQRDVASQGYGVEQGGTAHTITRPEQVLGEYGMTCYGTSVMFMLQSYGLVPPDMTRTEFEHAFTPLNPLHRGGEKTGPIATAHRAPGGAYTADAKGERWVDATADLNGGKLTADYFKDGNTVMTAVHLDHPPEGTLDHWVVVGQVRGHRPRSGTLYR